MKIKTLHIKGHKNLEDARLEHTGDLIAIIGNNGCGKSNLLEAISCIFKNLYKGERNIPFEFYLEYVTSDNKKIEIEKEKSKLSFRVDGVAQVSINEYLPKKVVAIYSGEENRLWKEYYEPFYKDYISNIINERHANLPQMLYLDKNYWDIALLCLSLSEHNKDFLSEVLKIKEIDKIKFEFAKSHYSSYPNSPVLNFVNFIDDRSEYLFNDISGNLEIMYSVDEVFSYLYMACSSQKKLIYDITVMFNNGLIIQDLSEGQKKLLLLKAALEFAGQEDTLYLLDEPDAHVHVNNKNKVIDALKPYIHNRQVVVTTHSPTITQCVDEKNLFMMNSGSFIPKNQQEIIEEITGEFWNAHQQNNFLASKKNIILLVEGKHDKEHIRNAFAKLKDEYPSLDFDVFNMNSANNIPQMMTGLRTNEVSYNKLFIGVFDDDDVGREELNKTNCSFSNNQNNKRHKEGFYAIKYPKHGNHKSSNFTVENFFSTDLLEECYTQALNESIGSLNGLSIDSISEKIMDKAKTKLSEASISFDKNKFENFRLLFDLINKIKEDYFRLNQALPNQRTPVEEAPNSHTNNPQSSQTTNVKFVERNQDTIFTLKKGGAHTNATYNFENNILTILSGSRIRKQEIPSFKQNKMRRDERIENLQRIDKIIDGNAYILNQDVEFDNLREAILFCTTTNLNPRTHWLDKNGKSLEEYIEEYDNANIV